MEVHGEEVALTGVFAAVAGASSPGTVGRRIAATSASESLSTLPHTKLSQIVNRNDGADMR